MRYIVLLISMCATFLQLYAQSISGNFSLLKGQVIRLYSLSGLSAYAVDSTRISAQGFFSMNYSPNDYGMGYITDSSNKHYLVVLEKDPIELKGGKISSPETISAVRGIENMLFENYVKNHARREQALSAWKYLETIYRYDSLFLGEKDVAESITSEVDRIQSQDHKFLSDLPTTSYVSWYLPLRKFLSSVPVIAQYNTKQIPATLTSFRNLNYADVRLYKSGLLKDVLQSHFWLLENQGLPLDSIYSQMSISTDTILNSTSANEKLYNEVVSYLFDYFEKHSLVKVSEHIAHRALNQKSIPLNSHLSIKLESYRKMKKGNIAPDIIFSGDIVKNGSAVTSPSRLSEIKSNYKVVIFGASWCSACSEEISQLLLLYDKWRAKGFEVVFVSLDTDPKVFNAYSAVMPFISFCDYQKWDTQAARDYFVFSSPSIYVLDSRHKILLKSSFIKGVDTWVDYFRGMQ